MIVAVGALLSGLQHYLLQRTGEKIVLHARRDLVRKLLRLPISEVTPNLAKIEPMCFSTADSVR